MTICSFNNLPFLPLLLQSLGSEYGSVHRHHFRSHSQLVSIPVSQLLLSFSESRINFKSFFCLPYVRLVSDKYIVGFSRSEWTDGLKVWDLRALIRSGSDTDGPNSSCALWTLPVSTDREWRNLIVDEYQVYAYGRFPSPDQYGVFTFPC